MQKLTGSVSKIIYSNEKNGYSIFCLEDENLQRVTVVGTCYRIQEHEYVKLYGEYVQHPQYGRQFKLDHYELSMPENLHLLESYLGTGIIKGVGKARAKAIIKRFGDQTMDILENKPERLTEIPGIGTRLAGLIGKRIKERGEQQEIFLKLSNYGVAPSLGVKIYREYKRDTFHILQTNPYKIANDIRGIGFTTADKIALENRIPKNSSFRIISGLHYVLASAASAGSVCMPKKDLIQETVKTLDIQTKEVIAELEDQLKQKNMILAQRRINGSKTSCIYTKQMYFMEQECAKHLLRLKRKIQYRNLDQVINSLDGTLDEAQMGAVKTAAGNGFMVLTGGPGVGKTTTTNLIIKCFIKLGKEVLLAAPTGRAAKRMAEATGHKASTIHRLLEVQPEGGFAYNKDNPLECDVLVIDEVSMLDLQLFFHLLSALPDAIQLVFVGDKDQLPSVGPGNVLGDIISSGLFPVVELTKIYRQAEGSDIIKNAHSILKGENLTLSNTDFFFKPCEDPVQIREMVLHYVADSLPEFTGEEEIQVLTPLKVRQLGATELNTALQERLNPGREIVAGFRIGDKVIQTRNNYTLEKIRPDGKKEQGAFNGDIGRIDRVDEEEEYLYVRFEDGTIGKYDFEHLDELSLAYALTVHKSQGSEYPVVVMPVYDYIPMITSMNLLYTGITRAKKYILLIGPPKRLYQIARNCQKGKRYTGLTDAIKEYSPEKG